MSWPKSRTVLAIVALLALPATAVAQTAEPPTAEEAAPTRPTKPNTNEAVTAGAEASATSVPPPEVEATAASRSVQPPASLPSATSVRKNKKKSSEELSAGDLEVLSLEALLDVQVVTASKEAVRAKDSAAVVTVFTRKQMEELNATQLIDLLPYVPGFYEVSAQYGRNVSVRGIHGATAQHIVVLKDGVPISDFVTATAALDVPLDDVERVEVVRGPGSALYGGNALMGVINLITRSADVNAGHGVRLSVGTNDYYRAAAYSNLGFKDENGRSRGLFLTASFWSFGGTRARAAGDEGILFPARGVNNSDGLENGETYTLPRSSTGLRVNEQPLSAHLSARYDASETLVLRGSFDHVAEGMQRNYLQMVIGRQNRDVFDTYENQRTHLDLEKSWGSSGRLGRLVLHPAVTLVRQTLQSQRLPKDVYADAAREEQSVVFGFSGNDLRASSVIDYHIDLPKLPLFQENSLLVGGQFAYSLAYDYRLSPT